MLPPPTVPCGSSPPNSIIPLSSQDVVPVLFSFFHGVIFPAIPNLSSANINSALPLEHQSEHRKCPLIPQEGPSLSLKIQQILMWALLLRWWKSPFMCMLTYLSNETGGLQIQTFPLEFWTRKHIPQLSIRKREKSATSFRSVTPSPSPPSLTDASVSFSTKASWATYLPSLSL